MFRQWTEFTSGPTVQMLDRFIVANIARGGGRPPLRELYVTGRSIKDYNAGLSALIAAAPSSLLAPFSLMLTLTEITDGFTRSTISAKPMGCATLRTSLLTCACAAVLNTSTGPCDGEKP